MLSLVEKNYFNKIARVSEYKKMPQYVNIMHAQQAT